MVIPVPNASMDATSIFIGRACAYAMLMLCLFDWLISLKFETLVIWSKSTDRRVRWLYATSRYLGLMTQCTNAFIVAFIQFDTVSSKRQCRLWHGFQLGIAQILLLALELTLVMRLHALYSGLAAMTRGLTAWFVLQTCLITACGIHAILHLEYSGDRGCLPVFAPTTVVCLAAAQIFSHLGIWILTIYRYFNLYFQSGWTKIPLLSLVTRDGFWVFILFTGLLSTVVADVAKRNFGETNAILFYVVFPLYVAVVSLSSCRITMNVRNFAAEVAPTREWDTRTSNLILTELSTDFELFQLTQGSI